MLDGGYEVDLDAVNRNIDEAEVVTLYFPLLRKTLLIDTRTEVNIGPLVCVVDMVDSSQERLRSLRRLRPQFPRPDSITLIPWTRRVGSLERLGVWAHVERRLWGCGDARCLEVAKTCLEQLLGFERREMRRAITGEHHETLWGRPGIGDEQRGPEDRRRR